MRYGKLQFTQHGAYWESNATIREKDRAVFGSDTHTLKTYSGPGSNWVVYAIPMLINRWLDQGWSLTIRTKNNTIVSLGGTQGTMFSKVRVLINEGQPKLTEYANGVLVFEYGSKRKVIVDFNDVDVIRADLIGSSMVSSQHVDGELREVEMGVKGGPRLPAAQMTLTRLINQDDTSDQSKQDKLWNINILAPSSKVLEKITEVGHFDTSWLPQFGETYLSRVHAASDIFKIKNDVELAWAMVSGFSHHNTDRKLRSWPQIKPDEFPVYLQLTPNGTHVIPVNAFDLKQ